MYDRCWTTSLPCSLTPTDGTCSTRHTQDPSWCPETTNLDTGKHCATQTNVRSFATDDVATSCHLGIISTVLSMTARQIHYPASLDIHIRVCPLTFGEQLGRTRCDSQGHQRRDDGNQSHHVVCSVRLGGISSSACSVGAK